MAATWTMRADAEDPSIALEWGELVVVGDKDTFPVADLSAASFRLQLVDYAGRVALTKTDGITGAATTPNVIVQWAPGELADLAPGIYTFQLAATGRDRFYGQDNWPTLRILPVPTPAS